jgi:cellulose synthase/poly-beta-1,6-N-acetylglucosamine synthase-like glycosyltransferase
MLIALYIAFFASVAAILYSYLVFPVVLTVLAKLFGKATAYDDNHRPSVAFVVPAYNEEEVIRQKIDNILSLDYPPEKLSVWVGSDQSTDRTNEIVTSIDDPRVHLWIAPERGGKTGILNGLVPRIEAQIVFMTDANTMHHRKSLRTMVRHFADPRVGGVAGHVKHIQRGHVHYEETIYRSFESRQKWQESMLHSSISAFGGFYTIRKNLFRPIPPNAYSNDDVLIPMHVVRQGYRMIFEPQAISEEETSEDARTEFSRRIRIGAGNFQAFFWLLDFLTPLRGWPAFCYLSHKVTRWFSPVFMVVGYAAAVALAFLAPRPALYQAMAGAGVVMIGLAMTYKVVPARLLRLLFYFFSMNAALLLGGLRFATGIRSAAWSRTSRGR